MRLDPQDLVGRLDRFAAKIPRSLASRRRMAPVPYPNPLLRPAPGGAKGHQKVVDSACRLGRHRGSGEITNCPLSPPCVMCFWSFPSSQRHSRAGDTSLPALTSRTDPRFPGRQCRYVPSG